MNAVKRKLREVAGFDEGLITEYQVHELPVKLSKREQEYFYAWQSAEFTATKEQRQGTRAAARGRCSSLKESNRFA